MQLQFGAFVEQRGAVIAGGWWGKEFELLTEIVISVNFIAAPAAAAHLDPLLCHKLSILPGNGIVMAVHK